MKSNIRKRIRGIISTALIFALLLISVPVGFWDDKDIDKERSNSYVVNADNTWPDVGPTSYNNWYVDGIYLLTTVERMLAYSRAYYSHPENHVNDQIRLGILESESAVVIEDSEGKFIPIGKQGKPFKGTVWIDYATSSPLTINTAFFDYIADSAQILNYSKRNESSASDRTAPILLARNTVNDKVPVLANHVVHDTVSHDIPTWKIVLKTFSEEGTPIIFNHSGILGEMHNGAKIKIMVSDQNTDSSQYGNVSGTGDIGYICGKMGQNCELTVDGFSISYQGPNGTVTENTSNTGYSVSTTSGHAGGVVGSMAEGSTLIMNVAIPNAAASITTTGTDKYAGGIVGYNDGGTLALGSIFSTSNRYAASNTITGVAGTGGLFGYYRPYLTHESSTFQFDVAYFNNASATENGAGSVGGLFGVLENRYTYSETETVEGTETTVEKTVGGSITVTDSTTKTKTVYAAHGDGAMSNYGGLIGQYAAADLKGSLTVSGVAVSVSRAGGSYSNYGGLIGKVCGSSNNAVNAAYVYFNNDQISVTSGNAANIYYGGLIADSTNAFVDVGNVTINSTPSFRGGGVIGKMDNGILRFKAGTTTSFGGSGVNVATAYKEGQIVGYRDSSLVYAENGWTISRISGVSADDIGSWGEVITFHDEKVSNGTGAESPAFPVSDVLSVDESEHTVQVVAPSTGNSYTSFSLLKDFAKTALCFKLNAADNPCLSFSDTTYNCTTVLSQDITLGDSIDLRHTGLTGFTRDNTETDSESASKCVYSGTFNGGGHSVILAVGEPNEKIRRHIYNGLFGIASGATISNVTIEGVVNVQALSGTMYVGGAAGRAVNSFASDGVNVSATFSHAGASEIHLGRLVGDASGTSITINSASTTSTLSGNVTGTNSASATCIGGMIGRISHNANATATWNINGVSISGEVSNTNSTGKEAQRIGGLIACISAYSSDGSAYNHRTLTLNGVTADGLTVKGTISEKKSSSGGLLGYSWFNTDVVMTDVDISNNSTVEITNNAANCGNMAGLVYQATGKWTVTDLDINSMNVKSAARVYSFGMLVNTGWYGLNGSTNDASDSSVLYLLLPSTGCYTASTTSGDTFTSHVTFTGSFTAPEVYDELVAYSAYYRTDDSGARIGYVSGDPSDLYVLRNRQGVVSIHTDAANGLKMDGTSSSQSYAVQTSFGNSANPYTRYYYNLDAMTGTSGAPALMNWGLYRYAHRSIREYFTLGTGFTETTIPTGDYDMTGYSWYPVDVDSSVTVAGNFTFANALFEGSETVKYNSNTSQEFYRTSLYRSASPYTTQHFLLHEGLFRNVTTTLSVGAVTFAGTIGALSTDSPSLTNLTGSGALVCGIVKGGSAISTATVEVSGSGSIELKGIKVHNLGSHASYAPLLINKSGSYSNLIIKGVSTGTGGYNGGTTAATSLIGIAGSASSKNVNVRFSDMKLDARNVVDLDNTPDSGYGSVTLDDIYHTTRSIFTRATFLHRYSFDPTSGSTGTYNFAYAKDWTRSGSEGSYTYVHLGEVTYGLELWDGSVDGSSKPDNHISGRNQYIGKEHQYSENEGIYVNPKNGDATTPYDFGQASAEASLKYLPYVYDKYSEANNKYQIQVNHASEKFQGCGTYNDPYLIGDSNDPTKAGDQLESIAKILSGSCVNGTTKIILPKMSATAVCGSDEDAIISTTWHDATFQDAEYTYLDESGAKPAGFYLGGNYPETVTKGTNYLSVTQVRTYLAGAYYKLSSNVTIDDTSVNGFKGLGSSEDDFAAFRGVIDGGNHTITNQTEYPLIASSYGSVVLDTNILVDANIEKEQASIAEFQLSSADGCSYYGAVMGQILGGDNIIDNTTVTFSTGKNITLTGAKKQLIPVGGYVGVVVNGGLIFRNMARIDNEGDQILYDEDIFKNVSFSPSDASTANSNTKWLYVNPIIGRVINGYAITESKDNKYRPFEKATRDNYSGTWTDGAVTMQNGTKNYSIADLNSSETGKLTVAGSTSGSIAIPNAQAFYIMSLIVNSGMGIMKNANTQFDGYYNPTPSNTTKDGVTTHTYTYYGVLGYYVGYCVTRKAQYNKVGENGITISEQDYVDSQSDQVWNHLSSSDKNTNNPYLITKYTVLDSSGYYPARAISNSSNKYDITLTSSSATYYLPDGYRGTGNFLYGAEAKTRLEKSLDLSLEDTETDKYVVEYKSEQFLLSVNSFDGHPTGSVAHTVNQNTSYYTYDYLNDNYSPYADNNRAGLGLFNCLAANSSIRNVTLTGSVKSDVYKTDNGLHIDYVFGNTNNEGATKGKVVSCGMLFGSANANITITDVNLININVRSARHAGGMIGNIPKGNVTIVTSATGVDSENITVHAGTDAGGLIGSNFEGQLTVNYNGKGFKINEIVSETLDIMNVSTDKDNYYRYGVGGLVGLLRSNSASVNNSISNTIIENTTEGNSAIVDSQQYGGGYNVGGMIGMVNRAPLTLNNCQIINVTCSTNGYAGGIVGWNTTLSPMDISNTIIKTDLSNRSQIIGNAVHPASSVGNLKETDGFAGGFVGYTGGTSPDNIKIDCCQIVGYTIQADDYAGGIVGGRECSNGKNTIVQNFTIDDCTLKGDAYVGGLIGSLKQQALVGYNILENNLSFLGISGDAGDITKHGCIVGNNNNQTIQLAGFSRQGSIPVAKMVGNSASTSDEAYGTGGYVVFADYNGTANSANDTFSTVKDNCVNVGTVEATGSWTTTTKYTIVAQRSGGTITAEKEVAKEVISGPTWGDAIEGDRQVSSTDVRYLYVDDVPSIATLNYVKATDTLSDVLPDTITTNGFYLGLQKRTWTGGKFHNGPFFIKDIILNPTSNDNRVLAETAANSLAGAAPWYFEVADTKYKIYTKDADGNKLYIHTYTGLGDKNKHIELVSDAADLFDVLPTEDSDFSPDTTDTVYIGGKVGTDNKTKWWLQHSGNRDGIRYWSNLEKTAEKYFEYNYNFRLYYVPSGKKLQSWTYDTGLTYTGVGDSISVKSGVTPTETDITTEATIKEKYTDVLDAAFGVGRYDNTAYSYEVIYKTETVTENVNVYSNTSPYVTTSPKLDIDSSQFLIGDSLGYTNSITYGNSTIKNILDDVATFTEGTDESGNTTVTSADISTPVNKGYNTAYSVTSGDLASFYKNLVVNGNYSTYQTEMGAHSGTDKDFPILVINDGNKTATTTLINTYLRMLTNTKFNFAKRTMSDGTTDASSAFKIVLGKCTYNTETGKFDADFSTGASCLKTNGSQIYIENSYDNSSMTGQFSLIDVQFFDPSDTSESPKVAYHLYVPVLVKKVFRFDFTLSLLSGTSYLMSDYEDYTDPNNPSRTIHRRGNNLIENVGNPITMEFRWTYRQTQEEWLQMLEGGESLLRNFDKKLQITDQFNNGLPAGSRMLLVDANNNNRVYYADPYTNAYNRSTGFINLNGFSGYTLCELNDFFTITMESTPSPNTDDKKTYTRVVLSEGVENTEANYRIAGATFRAADGNYYKPNDEGTGEYVIKTFSMKEGMTGEYEEDGDTYTGIAENYYITILTPSSGASGYHHLEITAPLRFDGDYPSLAYERKASHLITGNVFTNDFQDDVEDETDNGCGIKTNNTKFVMNATESATETNTVSVTMQAKIGLASGVRENFSAFIGSDSVSIYQSFLLSTIQQNYSGASVKEVKAIPTISYNSFTVGGTDVKSQVTPILAVSNKNYIELRDNYSINQKLASNDVIITADFDLIYDGSQIADQFPYRNAGIEGSTNVGTRYSGSSNISSNASAAAYSNTTSSGNDIYNRLYYRNEEVNASLLYDSDDAANLNGEFYQLGINALELDDAAQRDGYVNLKTRATYDVKAISDAIKAKSMTIKLRMKKKGDNYTADHIIYDYIKQNTIVLNDGNGSFAFDDSTNNKEFVWTILNPTTNADLSYDAENQVYSIPITYSIYTGDNENFEDVDKDYSNYMVEIEVCLYYDTAATTSIPGTNRRDHVIYTNAKIVTDIIEP